jgi:hypothetical protein
MPQTPEDLHREMNQRIASLEEAMAELRARSARRCSPYTTPSCRTDNWRFRFAKLGSLGCSLGFQREVDWHRRLQNVENLTVRVNHFLQFGEIGSSRAAFETNDPVNLAEAGANSVLHREEAAQVERAFQLTETLSSGMPSAVA